MDTTNQIRETQREITAAILERYRFEYFTVAFIYIYIIYICKIYLTTINVTFVYNFSNLHYDNDSWVC